MDVVESVQLIGLNRTNCPICGTLLSSIKCELIMYSGKQQARVTEGYIHVSIPCCHQCKLYYVTDKDISKLKDMTVHKPLIKTHDEYQKMCKPKSPKKKNDKQPIPIGKKIFHTGDPKYFGYGTITDYNGERITVKFESRKVATNLYLYPEHMVYYRFDNQILRDFLNKQALENSIARSKKNQEKLEKEKTNSLKAKSLPRVIDLSNNDELCQIYVCYGIVGCEWRDYHSLESVTVKVLTLERDGFVKLNVKYCELCGKYFIHHKSYEGYLEKYGCFMLRPISWHGGSANSYGDMYADLSPKSLLALHGYSASMHTTDVSRQEKLTYILEYRLMKKHDIITHLETLLSLQENSPNHFEANKKRKSDLRFLNDYDIERQREVFGEIVEQAERFRQKHLRGAL